MNAGYGFKVYRPTARHEIRMGAPLYVDKYGRFWGRALICFLSAAEFILRVALFAAAVTCFKIALS